MTVSSRSKGSFDGRWRANISVALLLFLTRVGPSALNYGFEMLESVVAFSSEELSKRMLQETSIVLGEKCFARITVMRPDNVIGIFRMFYSNSKGFCKYCRTKSFLSLLFEFIISNCFKHILCDYTETL